MVQLIQNGNSTACCFEVVNAGAAIGIIECKAFWDGMPYLSLLKIHKQYRGKGLGRQAPTCCRGS
ncbi:MAG: GNAT family N-acetyltransferase [Clostridia bacterium]|nr:GNAT family N-acetyltransferase [Clostridia bacterium]